MKLHDGRWGKKETAGAVYVEFLIAFLPIFFFFLALVQFMFICTAHVIVKHAAVKAARAAVVVIPDDPAFYDSGPGSVSGKRKSDIERAARIPLSTMGMDLAAVKITMNGSYGRDDQVTVKIDYDYDCEVPGGKLIACGFANTVKLKGEATLPNHGADYTYGP